MEEIVSADAIQAEIVEDARKKAARILEEADEESARTVAAIEGKAVSVVEEIMRTSAARAARFRMETMARLPLERTRMRTAFVETRLREALVSYMASFPEDRIAALAEEMLARGAPFFAGKAVSLARRGVSEAAARAIAERSLPASTVEITEDEAPRKPGLVARARDGSVTLWATMDLVEDRLLDAYRGDLSRALCADALRAEAAERDAAAGPGETRGL
jgi:vacuolar-type H+-ATPase subunit H